MLVNYHVPDFGLSSCTVAAVTMLDVKYSGEDLEKEKPNYLGVGCGLIGSAHVRMTNYFLEL